MGSSAASAAAALVAVNALLGDPFRKLDLLEFAVKGEKAADEGGDLKKKNVLSVLANLLFIKNENPDKKGNVRKLHYEVARQEHPNFFNQLWKTLLMGIIKSIGAPEKLAK